MSVKITIHTGVVFLDMITYSFFRNRPFEKSSNRPCHLYATVYFIIIVFRAAGQIRSGPELLPPGPKPHCMKSQQLNLFPILDYLILFQ
jgi:hypothetical protein